MLTLRDCTQLMCANYQGILIPAPLPPAQLEISVLSNINNCSILSPLCQHDRVFAKPVLKFLICQSMKKLENQLLQQVTLSDQIIFSLSCWVKTVKRKHSLFWISGHGWELNLQSISKLIDKSPGWVPAISRLK